MSDNKQLKDKAIDIKGKQYVMVKDRVIYFNENYPKASVVTEAILYEAHNMWAVKATVYPVAGEPQLFNGHGQEIIGQGNINKTSALENAETSAIGRALALMGIGVIDSIASIDEINKANNRNDVTSAASEAQRTTILLAPYVKSTKLTEEAIKNILKADGIDTHKKLSYAKHEDIIKLLTGAKNE